MSVESKETVADIVAEMRGPYYKMGRSNASLDKDMMAYMSFMADRIEKAADATYREKLYEYAILWDYDNSLFVKSIDYSYIKQKMDEVNADGPVCHLVRREVGEWEELPWRTENDARKNRGLPEDGYALSPLVCDLLSFADRIEAAAKREREATRENYSQVGNAEKMLEALQKIVLLTVKAGMSIRFDVACGIIASTSRCALAAPPRKGETDGSK